MPEKIDPSVVGGAYRFLLLPPMAWNSQIICPDCKQRMFDAGTKLSGAVTIVCKRCRRKWRVCFFGTDHDFIDASKMLNSLLL